MRSLLMGGQACVFYGAAEFSRDIDLVLVASPRNEAALRRALAELQAVPIAVPPFEMHWLRRGHALHFRCAHPDVRGLRVDVMSRMRGVDSFDKLWRRRTTAAMPDGSTFELLALPDLVRAKKTQRDKDWPMIRRLLEAHYFANDGKPPAARVEFWLRELRTPELLVRVAAEHERSARRLKRSRPLLAHALNGDITALAMALEEEERRERERDAKYWKPLRAELERLRHERRR